MKTKRLPILAAFVLLLGAGCSTVPKGERVSEGTLSQLRETYPYHDKSQSLGQFEPLPGLDTFEGYAGREDTTDAVALRVKGAWYLVNGSVSVFGNKEQDAILPAASAFEYKVIDAEVVEVFWSESGLEKGDTLTLSFGPTYFSDGIGLEEVYQEEQEYVCLMQSFPDNPFQVERLYRTSKDYTYYVTAQRVVLSVSSIPGADEVSGMYLESFREKLLTVHTKK